ncbi:SMC5-SMC6 complex localization factor protein 1 isoform X3 [Catharus ustulatus]|nr:SMC5-SMC6 complex localization factor protein 1 isoform X3 [Catharus ustulatus]
MASVSQKRIIQITGFTKKEKVELVKCLFKLNCVFIESKKYRNCTHLVAKKLCKSEKVLAACAAGNWILTKEYIINSAESGRWLDETTYEWGYEIERDTHYSPQLQSAPKRWREELTNSSAPGAFYRWKVVLPVKRGDKRMACIRRVLKAGKATICSSYEEHNITHVFIGGKISVLQNKKCLSEAQHYPVQYIGHYLFQSEIQNPKDTQMNHFLDAQETDQVMHKMQLAEMKNVIIKHMYFTATIKHRLMQTDQLNKCGPEIRSTDWSRGTWSVLQGLVEEDILDDVVRELAAGHMYSAPPVKLLHPLLRYVLLGNSDAMFFAKLCHVFYLVLHCEPPWKSPSMLKYYLDLLQCPICRKGTWSLIEMLVRSCLYCETICHTVTVSGREDELRMVHKTLLKFFSDLVKGEVEFLTKSLVEGTNSQHQQALPQTVLLKTFLLESGTAVLFTKHINILADWVIFSHRELNGKNDAFRSEIAGLLNAILGTIVDYWIISGLLMDRNVFHQVPDLTHYLAISCDDFSVCQLKMFVCAIPSDWLQLFLAEAIFKQMCLQRNIAVSTEPLSLQKIVCSYSPALREIGMRETKIHKAKKIGQQLCPESQRTLQMLNGDKQNQVKVLPDLPDLISNKLRAKAEFQTAHTKESYLLAVEVHKRDIKGETTLHKACRNNKVEKLIQLLSLPGTDINVRDCAGWTPLHEACNHGSTVCVHEILERCPEVDLLSQVDGVTPLHDALSNGHLEIGKLLLQHGGPVLLEQRNSHDKLPLDYVESDTVKEELLNLVYPGESIENFNKCREQDFCNQKKELCLISFTKMLLNFCSVYNLSTPLTVTLRAVACSNVLPVMVCNNSKMKYAFSGDWLVDAYFKELETFEKLPQFFQEISGNMLFFPGEHAKALLAVLETMVEPCQVPKCFQKLKSKQATLAES